MRKKSPEPLSQMLFYVVLTKGERLFMAHRKALAYIGIITIVTVFFGCFTASSVSADYKNIDGKALWETLDKDLQKQVVSLLLRASASAFFFSVESFDNAISSHPGDKGDDIPPFAGSEIFMRVNLAKISLARTAGIWMEASGNDEFLTRVSARVTEFYQNRQVEDPIPLEAAVVHAVGQEMAEIYGD